MEKQKLLCQIVNLKFLFIILNKTALRGYTSTVIFCQKSLGFKPQLKMQNLIPIAKNSLFKRAKLISVSVLFEIFALTAK